MTEMLKEITINKNVLRRSTATPFITSTDLADYLVSNYSYSFRQSHQIVGQLVKKAEALSCDLKDLDLKIFQEIEPSIDESIFDILTIENSVKSKTSYGGTSPSQVKERIIEWQKMLK